MAVYGDWECWNSRKMGFKKIAGKAGKLSVFVSMRARKAEKLSSQGSGKQYFEMLLFPQVLLELLKNWTQYTSVKFNSMSPMYFTKGCPKLEKWYLHPLLDIGSFVLHIVYSSFETGLEKSNRNLKQ